MPVRHSCPRASSAVPYVRTGSRACLFAPVGLGLLLTIAPLASALADTVEQRLECCDLTSVFQAWSPVEVAGEGELDSAAGHDLLFTTLEAYGLQWAEPTCGLATGFAEASVTRARGHRAELLARNPT